MVAAPVQLPGVVAGRYELECELARGGMGVVYRARDRATNRVIALKRSLEDREGAAHVTRSMLQREYQTLVTLRHPNIIQVYDFGVDALGPYYTMELLDGADLRAKCPLPWREVCAHLRDIASSLALLHSRRLLHCDVSVANVRLTVDGRAKLLDFGTLASFGRSTVIAGSPPGIAPEMFQREELDQRVDLYALGATAYYALCGRHAYPVAILALLPTAWEQGRPPPPSATIPDIPRELDELVLSLLDLDRMSRPASAAEVIDRLGAIAGLPPDQDQRVQRSYLYSAEVVARELERKLLDEQLGHAVAGRGGGALIDGAAGLGKTFLLEDFVQRARVAGARVIVANARAHRDELGTWSALVREATSQAGTARPSSAETGADDMFFQLASSAPLLLAIEDLHEADTESVNAFAALAKSARQKRIMLVATLDLAHPSAERPAFRALRSRLATIKLRPFDEKATQAFVQGLFGEVAAVPLLASFLYSHAAGNPRTYTEVIHHLISEGFIRYAEGTWVLPDELPAVGPGGLELSKLVDAAFESRIAQWSVPLRTLALLLSPSRRAFDLALCRVLVADEPGLDGKELEPLLKELVRESVLVEDQGAYTFDRSRMRDILYRRLSDEQKKRQHARLATAIIASAGQDPVRWFEIGFHLLLAGEVKRARRYINRGGEHALVVPDMVVAGMPDIWALLEHQRSIGATDQDVQFIEGGLVFAGYYSDPTIHDRFGDRVLVQMHRTFEFPLATRLVPWLGNTLAFSVGLTVAWFRNLFKPYLFGGNSFFTSLIAFVSVAASLSASACFRLDRKLNERLLSLLSVAGGLPRLHPLRMSYDLFRICFRLIRGGHRDVLAGLEDQLARLPRVPMLTKEARAQYEAALLVFVGRNHLQRIDSKTLEHTEQVIASGSTNHDRLMAHLLRSKYYLHRGDLAGAKREGERFDEMAAKYGSRWTADVMAACEFTPYHLAGDVLGLKRTLHRIERLAAVSPGLATHREVIRAMYEGHRGRPDLALEIYRTIDAQIAPFEDPTWSLARGHQAECLNMLGRHSQALSVCEVARAQLHADDRPWVFAYQQLERETAQALTGLGRIEEAVQLAEALIAECAPYDNPLISGLLHYDRARIACVARDSEAFERHAEAAKSIFASTANPALIARGKRLFELGRAVGLVQALPSFQEQAGARFGLVRNLRAERVLDDFVQNTGTSSACLYLMVNGRAVRSAQHGDASHIAPLHRDVSRLVRTLHEDSDEDDIARALGSLPLALRESHRVLPLLANNDNGEPQLVALLVVGDADRSLACTQTDLTQIASELVQEENTELIHDEG
ncbi:MAG TPA: protein kinase [Polyangiales bacterium]